MGKMKRVIARRMVFETEYPSLGEISAQMDKVPERHAIAELNWPTHRYLPDVEFVISFTTKEILLKYFVTENWFKAEKVTTNDRVYEDSCVEFFVSPGSGEGYYNFEFNGIGTCLAGYGKERNNREMADPSLIEDIRRKSTAGSAPVLEREGRFSWSITIAFPYNIFFRHEITDLQGKSLNANFYKCGDKLKVPHYVTWNQVLSPNPDFHRPEFFGTIDFE